MTAIPLPQRAPSSGKRRRHHAKQHSQQFRMLGVARSKLRDGEIGVDGFAGGGGFSLGFQWATGAPPAVAINHDKHAIWMHTLNHPESKHYPEDIFHVLPKNATLGRPVGLAHFSPDCTDFSPAKGGKPLRQKIRGLAWVILLWACEVRPRILSLENVPAFEGWGPLDPETDKRIKDRVGETFRAFVACLSTGLAADHPSWADAREALLGKEDSPEYPRIPLGIYKRIVKLCTKGLGYQVDWRTLNAADFGAPTSRKRLYLIARCDGEAPRWPVATHGPRRGKKGWKRSLKPYRTAGECIDFTLPCPSIFLSRKEGRALGVNRPLRPATLRRIAEGIRRYVLENPHPYIVRVSHGQQSADGSPRWGQGQHDAAEPLGTVTGSNDFAVVVPTLVSNNTNNAPHSIDDPLGTVTTGHRHFAVAPQLLNITHGGRPEAADEPTATITAAHRGEKALVAPTLIQTSYGERKGQAPRVLDLDNPLGTVVAQGVKHAEVHTLLKHYGGPRRHPKSCGKSPDDPVDTITAAGHHSLMTATMVPADATLTAAYMAQHNTGETGHEMTEPVSTIVGKGCTQGVVEATLVQQSYGTPQWQDPDAPLNTIVSGVNHNELVSAHLTKFNTGSVGSGLDEPAPTITGGGGSIRPAGAAHGLGVAAVSLTKFNGTSADGQPADEPMHTVTSGGERGGGYAGLQACSLLRFYGSGGQWQGCDDPACTVTAKDRFALVAAFLEEYLPGTHFGDAVTVEIEGETYVLADIGMRMLQPRELARAQGFPDDYILPGTKSQQVARIGNSVCPDVARAIVAANLDEARRVA